MVMDMAYRLSDTSALPWIASRLAPGVHVKNLGKCDGRAMQLVRFQPGAEIPSHVHPGPEFLYVLEGEAIQNGNRLGPGYASVSARGTVDDRFRSDTGCVLLLVYTIPGQMDSS